MSLREKLLFMFLIWAVVFPGVLVFGYGLQWMFPDWPFWLRILVSTGLTVPLISLVALPIIEKTTAKIQGISRAELKQKQAEAALKAERGG